MRLDQTIRAQTKITSLSVIYNIHRRNRTINSPKNCLCARARYPQRYLNARARSHQNSPSHPACASLTRHTRSNPHTHIPNIPKRAHKSPTSRSMRTHGSDSTRRGATPSRAPSPSSSTLVTRRTRARWPERARTRWHWCG